MPLRTQPPTVCDVAPAPVLCGALGRPAMVCVTVAMVVCVCVSDAAATGVMPCGGVVLALPILAVTSNSFGVLFVLFQELCILLRARSSMLCL